MPEQNKAITSLFVLFICRLGLPDRPDFKNQMGNHGTSIGKLEYLYMG